MSAYVEPEKYRPLPSNLYLAESPIEGFGIFAQDIIEKGTALGITHVAHDKFIHGWIRTPLGGFLNHSDIPNCRYKYIGTEMKVLETIKDIMPEEELTVSYTLYDVGDLI